MRFLTTGAVILLLLLLSGIPLGAAGPADLVDIVAIRSLELNDLAWEEESRREMDGTVVVGGSWTGPPFRGYDAGFGLVDTRLGEYATLYLPAMREPGTEVPILVWAAHYEENARTIHQPLVDLVGRVPLAVLVHGEKAADWTGLGFSSRDALMAMGIVALSLANQCEPRDYRFGNYFLALAETQLMAITLAERLLAADGFQPRDAALMGYSKEGFSTWFASAVDERIVTAAPGGWHLEDILAGLDAEEESWGCDGSIGGAVEGRDLLAFRNWLAGSPGGQRALDYYSVNRFSDALYPEFLLLHGDVGLHDLHDGIYYTPGAETSFLEGFSERDFRYDRKVEREEAESDDEWFARLARLLAHQLLTRDPSAHPGVTESSIEMEPGRFRALARAAPVPDSMTLWWSHSPDRAFDDPDNAPWRAVPLVLEGVVLEGDTWISPWVDIPPGEGIGWYVEAESLLEWEGFGIPQRDAGPQRFVHENPPRSCPDAAVPDCPRFRRGDVNSDGGRDLSDAVSTLGFLFLGSPARLECPDAADVDDTGEVSLTDAVYLLNFLFLGGQAPAEPLGACGNDPTGDGLNCTEHPPCEEGFP